MPKAGDSRTQLVQTMARLLRDQGYTATGLSQVLAESGVSNGSLYHHFPGGMEELAEAALEAFALEHDLDEEDLVELRDELEAREVEIDQPPADVPAAPAHAHTPTRPCPHSSPYNRIG